MLYSMLILTLPVVVQAAPTVNYSSSQLHQYITLEEHCVPPSLASELNDLVQYHLLVNGTFGPRLPLDLMNTSSERISSLNENDIRIQILNNNLIDPWNATQATLSNTAIYDDYTSAHPERFKAFCSLAMGNPLGAAAELERCITKLGFVGGFANAMLPNGSFFDSPSYWPVFAMAETLNVPIYLHPPFAPNDQVVKPDGGQYAPAVGPDGRETFDLFVAANLGTTAWGFESNTGLSFLRLYSAGLFDQHPNFKVILGHMGEMLPYMLERSHEFLSPLTAPGRSLLDVYAKNVWITTSGWFWLNQIPTVLANTAIDKIMYSVDSPFNKNYQGTAFMKKLRTSGLVTEEQFQAIGFRNAEKLFGLCDATRQAGHSRATTI